MHKKNLHLEPVAANFWGYINFFYFGGQKDLIMNISYGRYNDLSLI